MKRNLKKAISFTLAVTLIMGSMTSDHVQAKKKPQLSAKKISIQVGSKKKLKVKNTKKKVIWTIKSGKKNVSLLSKKKTSVTIAGKKAGEAKIQAKAAGKKLICKVTVTKKESSQTGTPTTEPGATAENSAVIPTVNPTANPGVNSTDSPKETAKADSTPKETTGATPAITPGVNSTDSPKETAKATPTVSPKATTTPVPSKYGLNNPTYINGVTTWDCVYFGSYLQYDTNGDKKVDENDEEQPIMWRVLSVDGDDAFLLADQCLDEKGYNDPIYDEDEEIINNEDVTWATCSLRTWLNDSFLKKAFSEQEQKAIIRTTVVNEDNMEYYDPEDDESYDIGKGGNNTDDFIYFLSISEARNEKFGLRDRENNSLRATGTQYAGFYDSWWLRSPGSNNRCAAVVEDGDINDDGRIATDDDSSAGVRPVLHLDLSSGLWKKAPKVSGTGDELKIDPVSDYSPEKTEANDTYGLDNPSISNGVTTWDCVYFGNYWQEADGNKKQPVKWRVLSVKDNDAFLLADKCLDCQPYNQIYSWKKWESCSLRSWLNDTFLNNAFSEQEQEAIFDTTVVNECDPHYYITGGADTVDKIYLLSESEIVNVAYGFNGDQGWDAKSRVSKATPYAVQKGVYVIPDDVVGDDEEWIGNAWWWLRSPCMYIGWSSAVNAAGSGGIGSGGAGEYADKDFGVRPVLHLNLSSDLWKHAGKVTSNDE